jgi:hypothetical protein
MVIKVNSAASSALLENRIFSPYFVEADSPENRNAKELGGGAWKWDRRRQVLSLWPTDTDGGPKVLFIRLRNKKVCYFP